MLHSYVISPSDQFGFAKLPTSLVRGRQVGAPCPTFELMNITIRKAEYNDLDQVNLLRRQVNSLHVERRPDIFRAGFCDEMRDRLFEVFSSPDYDVFVAEADKKVKGFATVEYATKPLSPYNNERRYYRIEEFGVDEGCHRQGVGTALMTYLKNDAKEKGYEKLELDVWEFNASAVEFYDAQGFSCYRRFLEVDL